MKLSAIKSFELEDGVEVDLSTVPKETYDRLAKELEHAKLVIECQKGMIRSLLSQFSGMAADEISQIVADLGAKPQV